ncbi:MAG: threonylcarbamoyl-AMP synthase [Gammaproteobacteria bacterium]|nr:threonylcarbamoyl-AMP synthase [Gammaproteobacteria bacterium]
MTIEQQIEQAVSIMKNGGVIAYPTEAVFGLGCDPFNEQAVQHILELKQRDTSKGLIIIAASWKQIKDFVQPVPELLFRQIQATWPGPTTWIFHTKPGFPQWVTGKHNSVAIRVTDHPIAKSICEQFNGPIISTSANLEGQAPAKTTNEVQTIFNDKLDLIIDAKVGDEEKPTTIYSATTGQRIR